MNDPSSTPCPECGNPVPTGGPHSICPACLMAQALASQTLDGEKPPSSPPPAPEEIADKFPQFEILECLGRGGMGIVYKARQKSLNRLVAIKILAPEREHDARFAERFAREAELLAKLSHPHIVTIHDFGETGGLYFLVMEFVDGVNLRDLLREGKLESKQALAIVPPICEALQYAHDKGIVHRDIKPENLLLDREGRIKIADFGIASLIGASAETSGTPPYMAPEQRGVSSEVDHRADIYALGVVFYEMLTGERPAEDLVAPSKKTPLDARLDEMVLRALEKEPEKRYQTAGEMRTMVETMGVVPSPAPRGFGQAPFKTGRGRISVQDEPGAGLEYPKLGELAIHADHLVVSLGDSRREVPLSKVRGLGSTVPPWWFSPAGHRFAAIDFDEDGKHRKLVFMSGEGAFRLVGTTQSLASEWLTAIQRAVKDSTGIELPISKLLPVFPIKSNWSLMWLGPLVVALITAKVLMSPESGSGFRSTDLIALLPLLIPIAIPLVILVIRNRTIRVGSGEAGAPSSITPSSGFGGNPLLIGCGVICLFVFVAFILFGGSLFWLRRSNLDAERQAAVQKAEVDRQPQEAVSKSEAARRELKRPPFGPVTERVVRNREAIDLDARTTITMKDAGFEPMLELEMKELYRQELRAIDDWMVDKQLDALSDGKSLTAFGMKVNPLKNEDWDSLDSVQVEEALRSDWRDQRPAPFLESVTPKKLEGPPYTQLTPNQFGGRRTVAFQTREGGTGMLQILGTTDAGLKIRYKFFPIPPVYEGGTEVTLKLKVTSRDGVDRMASGPLVMESGEDSNDEKPKPTLGFTYVLPAKETYVGASYGLNAGEARASQWISYSPRNKPMSWPELKIADEDVTYGAVIHGEFPQTLLFKNQVGRLGLLQVIAVDWVPGAEDATMKLRWKWLPDSAEVSE